MANLKLEYTIAKRYLGSKRKESFISFVAWFSLIGIALGVAVLIIVMSVMNGFRKEIINNFIGTNGHILIYGENTKFSNYEETIKEIKGLDGIKGVSPAIFEQGLLAHKNNSTGAVVYGLNYEDLGERELLEKSIKNNNLSEFKDNKNVILLGRIIMRNLGLNIGDNITLISPNGYSTIMGSLPRIGSYKIVGIINTGMYQYDSTTAVLPLKVAQEFFFYNNAITRIEVFIDTPQEPNEITREIALKINPNYYIETWQDSNQSLINALIVERNVMFLILSLVILIAAFNIISGLVMLVRSKTKEIAILRAMGLSKKSVITIFLLVGIRIGFIGTLCGAIIGILFSYNIDSIKVAIQVLTGANLFAEEVYFLSQLPSDIKSEQIVAIIIMALSFSILAAIYPALRAAKVKPAEGLKYE